MRLLIAVWFSLSAIFSVSAQSIEIYGNAGSYAGDMLMVNRYEYFITKQTQTVGNAYVDSLGNFSFSVNAKETALYSMPLGVFEGLFYAKPGDSIQLVLPQKIIPDKRDSLNPFFRPQKYYLRNLSADENDLTQAVRLFDFAYEKEYAQLFENNTGRVNSLRVDSAVARIESGTPAIDCSFFSQYKFYRFAELRHSAYHRNKEDFVRQYFYNKTLSYKNPAYHDALESALGNTLTGADIRNLRQENMNAAGIWRVLNTNMAENELYSDGRFREYILLLNLRRLAFESQAGRLAYIHIFESAYRNTGYAEHKTIIRKILEQLSGLRNGSAAPLFSLKNLNGDTISLSDLRGKFVYLNFFSEDSYTGGLEIALLEGLYHQELPGLEIVSIYTGHSFERFKKFVEKNKFSFKFLYTSSENAIIEQYRVMRFPEYYLIHPNGTLLMISAPGPADNFRSVYGNYYTEWNRAEIRRKSKPERSLIDGQ